MVATVWGTEAAADFSVTNDAGDQVNPAVADSGGGSFGVAWTSTAGVTVRFYDVVGKPDPALGTIIITDHSNAANVSLTAGGAVGYAATWEENGSLWGRYIGLSGPVGTAFQIDAPAAGFLQHDAVMGGYAVDNPATRKSAIDGFNVVWVSTDSAVTGGVNSQGLTQAQINAGYGQIMLQRYAVPLDAKVDPIGPPAPAGLDGVAVTGSGLTNTDANSAVQIAAVGRDPSTIVTHDGETVITWIDLNNQVHLQVYDLGGNNLNGGITIAGGGTLNDIDGTAAATGAGVTPGLNAKVVDLAGAGFVVAWVGQETINIPGLGPTAVPEIRAVVFTPGAAAGTYTAGAPISLEVLPVGFNGDFSLGTLVDSGGFSLSYSVTQAGDTDVFVKAFDSNGASLGTATQLTLAGDQTASALAGLVGDRIIAVYQDDASGNLDVSAQILDTRTLPDGSEITLNGQGLTLNGDDVDIGRPRARADVLVGTIGQDFLNGLLSDDELYGALGNDRLAGGAGNDILDGGGGTDTAVFTGNFSDYIINYLGADLFEIQDTRGGSPDGTDTLRGIELLEFADTTKTTLEIISGITPVTPTAWGWTNEDADNAPNREGTPDVDGFLVNHAGAGNGNIDRNAFVADSVGEFLGVVWEHSTDGSATTHIQGQFYDVIGAFDEFMPNVVNLSDGVGIETNPVIVSGGANSGWGIAFEELTDASDVAHTIRTNFQGPGFLTGPELTVFDEGELVDQHDAALSGSFLDRTLDSPVGGSVLPTGMNEGYNVVWVSTDINPDGTPVAGDASYGRIMMQRFEVPLDALGNPGAPIRGGVDGIAGLDGHTVLATADGTDPRDGAFWVGDELGGVNGAVGRNPSTTALHGFETIVIWIEQGGAGGERVAGRAYDDLGQVIPVAGLNDISAGFSVAAGTTAHVVSAGAVNFGIVWVTESSPGVFTVMGNMYAPTGAGLDGEGFGFGAPAPFTLFDLPAGVDPLHLDFHATGISGEDSEDLIVSWSVDNGSDGKNMMAQHIQVALDPVTGQVIAMAPEGDAITVNAETAGNQDGGTVAGLLGDRFIAVYHDDNPGYTDGNDIVARIIDTRDAVNPDPIIGDLIRNGRIQSRRDVLIGTNGNDQIQGDISTADGLVDYIFAGMGDDIIFGGGGLRGAAGIPEIIIGGEGVNTAVYSGSKEDYSITVNGDGSLEVIDLRPTQNAAGDPLSHDGIDNLYDIQILRFLNLPQEAFVQNGPAPALPAGALDTVAPAGAEEIIVGFPGTPPPLNQINGIDQGPYDGTPLIWSLDDTSPLKEIAVDVDPTPGNGADADHKSGVAVTNLQDGAALAWVTGGNEVWAISYDTTMKPDPVFLAVNTELTDGSDAFADNTVGSMDIAMTGGLGFTAVWESTDTEGDDVVGGTVGDTSLHLRFASTNTHVVLDPAGGVPGPGLAVDARTGAAGEIVVVGSDGAGVAEGPAIQGYEIVDVNNDTLEVGFHVGFVQKASAGDTFGTLMLARYEIPVYDILVGADGLPVLDANGQGQLARDAFGNLVPSTVDSFGGGSETAPISIGLDGVRGTADDSQAMVLTNAGLFAANDPLLGSDPDHTPIQGREISIGSLHDGQLVVTYIGTDNAVHLKIYVPSVDEAGDREANAGLGGVDVQAQGITAYSELALPATLTAGLGAVAADQTAMIVPQQNGSFAVFWAADDGAGGVDIQGIIYSGAGTNWSASPLLTFASGLDANVHFQVAPTGVDPGGLEDGFFVTWEASNQILGQRFSMAGDTVGLQVVVGEPDGLTPALHSSAGIDDGLMLFGYQDGDNISAQVLDNREPGVALIGPRTGAPRDVIVGTVGDDAIDGRALGDELYGGLGNDLITMGSGSDIGFGGLGNDTIIGGTGQDQLLGEAGNDLLWGGLSGPADPKVSREVVDGLVLANFIQVDAAGNPITDADGNVRSAANLFGLDAPITIDIGSDIISGGDGNDTISYQGEFASFLVDLSVGVAASDRNHDGTFIVEDLIGQLVDDGAGGTPFQFILDIENATGGYGNDLLIGDNNANILIGGAGNDTLNGGGGDDLLRGDAGDDHFNGGAGFDKAFYDPAITTLDASMFSVDVQGNWVVTTGTAEGTDTLTGIELVDGNRFILIGGSSDFQTVAQAEASGQLVDGDILLTFDGTTVTSQVFQQTNPSAPIAGDDMATTPEDTPVSIDVITNSDSDPDGTAVVVDPNSLVATHGTAVVDANGHILFTPDADFNGTATVQYRVLDTPATGSPRLSNVATVTIDVTPTPDAPVAVDDEAVATEAAVNPGVAGTGNVLLNDLDPDLPADLLTVAGIAAVDAAGVVGAETAVGAAFTSITGAFGTLQIKANGDFIYIADDNNATVNTLTTGQSLDDVFSYRIVDSQGNASTALITATIDGANDAPILASPIADQTASTTAAFNFTVPAGTFTDVDTPNLVLSATLANGQPLSTIGLSFNPATRAFTGTPTQEGVFDIRVSAFDGQTTVSDTFTVDIAGNKPPTNVALSNATFSETSTNGFIIGNLSATDPDGLSSAVKFSLTDDAGGRFQIIKQGGVFKLAVAENLLIDHRPDGDGNHTYTVRVTATDALGAATVQMFSVTSTGVAENRITGTAADNTLNGTAGNDYIDGGAGKDTMTGLGGNDVYVIDNSGDKVVEGANAGNDTIYTNLAKFDMGAASNVENLVYTGTGSFDGKLNNTGGTLVGGAGSDKLQGGNADDLLEGLAGNDTISGGNGNDRIIGGAGDDTLTGGNGNDTLVFRPGFGHDTVTDFNANNADIIEFSASLFADFADIQAHMQQVGQDVLITVTPDDTVLLQRTTLASLDRTDFVLV